MRNAYIRELYELAKEDPNVLGINADNGAIVYDDFRRDFPKQYMNFGIAEANMIAAAAGMASCGKIPFCYTIGAFLAYRALEFIRNDVCYQKQNVKIVGIGSGCAYANLGPTHHTTEDIAILRSMPGLTIFSPASPLESKKATRAAYEWDGPVYIRLGRNGEPEIYDKEYNFVPGKGVVLRKGKDVTIIGTGGILLDALEAAEALEKQGISARVVNIHTIKPLDEEIIQKAAEETKAIVTIEEHSIYGGLGGAVAEVLAEYGRNVRFRRVGLKGFVEGYGDPASVKKMNGIDGKAIVENVLLCLNMGSVSE